MSMMVSFVLSFFPRDVLDEILNLIESVSEDFLTTLPSHLGPPRPTLSINQYVRGCLDCTVGAFHMSIPAENLYLL